MSGFLDDIPGIPAKPRSSRPEGGTNMVSYTIPRCPKCGSGHCPAYDSRGRLKYRKCGKCGHTFKSFIMNWVPTLDEETPPATP